MSYNYWCKVMQGCGRWKNGGRCMSDFLVSEVGYLMQQIEATVRPFWKRPTYSKWWSHEKVADARCELEWKHSEQTHGPNNDNFSRWCRHETKLASPKTCLCGIMAVVPNCQFRIFSCYTERPCANVQTITAVLRHGRTLDWSLSSYFYEVNGKQDRTMKLGS